MILEKNCKSVQIGKSGHYRASMSQRREPTLRCRPTLRRGIPLPRRGLGAKNGTPRVCHGEALLRHGVATVPSEQFFLLLFRKSSFRTLVV